MDNARPVTTVKEVLIATKWILENVGWCQGNMFQDANGKRLHQYQVSMKNPPSKCCLSGAIQLVVAEETDLYLTSIRGPNWTYLHIQAWDVLHRLSGPDGVSGYNDSHTREEVIALVDEGISVLP